MLKWVRIPWLTRCCGAGLAAGAGRGAAPCRAELPSARQGRMGEQGCQEELNAADIPRAGSCEHV